ncbi:hypothetical protein JW916_14170 [Candidatus Sumerlaeota bacterium]|nr:hypothetical protein [Candidatus Sumerlaeota bacterium]
MTSPDRPLPPEHEKPHPTGLRRFAPSDAWGWMLVLLGCAIQAVVLYNALRHHPTMGYDSKGYSLYIRILATGRFPTAEETWEFFSPPLPFLPSAAYCVLRGEATRAHLFEALRFAQILNFVYSGLLLWGVARLCRTILPGRRGLPVLSLLLIGALPVYYRTFAFVRAEPLLALLFVLAVLQTLRVTVGGDKRRAPTIWLGLIAGGMILTRQWAFFFFPALFLFLGLRVFKRRETPRRAVVVFATVCLVAFLAGGWFYVYLKVRHGGFSAFNRKPFSSLLAADHPRSFYLSCPLRTVFTDPVRPSFRNQAWPIFYADTWGDYWAYFLVHGRDREGGYWLDGFSLDAAIEQGGETLDRIVTNRYEINRYLGRVNAASIPLSFLFVAGFLWGGRMLWRTTIRPTTEAREESLAWIFLVALACVVGYAGFVFAFPTDNGDTVKPTYVLHVFVLVSILAADLVLAIGRRSPRLQTALVALVVLTALHNLPTFFTRFCGT